MDKEIDKERLKKLNPIPLRLSKQTMPNGTVYYRGNVKALKTVDIQEIARRIVEDRSEIRESTFIHTYGLIKEQIYAALARGENVDLGFGQLSIRVKGQFESASDSFDPERNAFNIVFTPSAMNTPHCARNATASADFGSAKTAASSFVTGLPVEALYITYSSAPLHLHSISTRSSLSAIRSSYGNSTCCV